MPTLAAPPTRPLTPLIGREHEIEIVRAMLRRPEVRLVTITGAGGSGKTRLALELARELAGAFADGVALVPLAPLTDSALVPSTIAQTIDVRESGARPAFDALVAHLAGKEFLLICDNFESVADAAPFLVRLIAACPCLRILVTSRVSLRVTGERVVPLPPLDAPVGTVEDPATYPAVRLFVDRALAANPRMELTAGNLVAIATICRHLDGLPLALELAAARIKVLSPPALLGRLDHRLTFLTGGARDLPARQQTMRDTIAWSYHLLEPDEQSLFCNLSVFMGGFTLEAAEAICGPSTIGSVLDLLSSLLEKSVVREVASDEPRYTMLETLREYGLERLHERGEEATIRQRHAAWFLELAEQARPHLYDVERGGWLVTLEADHPNLRAALTWSIDQESPVWGQRLVEALWPFWETNGHVTEGRAWIERVLAHTDVEPTSERAGALAAAAGLALRHGDYERTWDTAGAALEIWRPLGNQVGTARMLTSLGNVAIGRNDFVEAIAFHEEALTIRREVGRLPPIGTSLHNLGMATTELGDYERAWAIHQEQLVLEQSRGDPVDVAFALAGLGTVAHRRGDLKQAADLHEEALALRRRVDPRGYAVSVSIYGLGLVLSDLGELMRANDLLQECLSLRLTQGEQPGVADTLQALADVVVVGGPPDLAVRLIGATDAIRAAISVEPTPFEHTRREQVLSKATRAMGAEGVSAVMAIGQVTSLAEIVAEIKRYRPPAPDSAPMTIRDLGLSPRELDVLRVLVEGHSDREIGQILAISHRTVMAHVSRILAKMGVSSRSEVAAFAHVHQLDLS